MNQVCQQKIKCKEYEKMGTVLNQAKEALRTYEQVKEDAKKCVLCILVQRKLSFCYIVLTQDDFFSCKAEE